MAGRAPCAGGGHFVTDIPLRSALPMVARENLRASHRSKDNIVADYFNH
jgi:hypothetical protein